MATSFDQVDSGKTAPMPARKLKEEALAAIDRGDHAGAIEAFEALQRFSPDNPDILSNLGVLYFQTGDGAASLQRLERAHQLAPGREDIKNNFLNVQKAVAGDSLRRGDHEIAIQVLREALSQNPANAGLRVELSNLLEVTGQAGILSDYAPHLTPDQLGSHILIACMPKSGSSFLKETLRVLTGWPEVWLSYAFLQNEQEIYLPALLDVATENTVTQQHCRATGPNLNILQGFGVRPVILTRNLSDIVLSLSDFYDSGAVLNTFFGDIWPELDQGGKHDLIIDHVIPWYAGFKASWERAVKRRSLECLFLSYEEMISDKPAALLRVSEFLELGKTEADCAAAIGAVEGNAEKTRFNKGVAGRGAATLTPDQIARIDRLAAAYAPEAAP